MKYQFEDKVIFASSRISLGVEKNSGTFYISCSFTTANRTVDYDKYFSLTLEEYTQLTSNEVAAEAFASQCLMGKMDNRLIFPIDK
jgi:hypothetical protein